MAAIENSIAANINRADKIRQHIDDIGTDYKNTTPGQTVADYTSTLNQLSTNITTLTKERQNLKDFTADRKNYMKKPNFGLFELLLRLKSGVISQYKENSAISKKITALIDKYRAQPTEEPPKTQDIDGNPIQLPKTKSQFQSGYDSKEGILKDIVDVIANQTDYNPVHPDVSKKNLQAALSQATRLNDDVFEKFKLVVNTLTGRNLLYTYLFYDTKGIKNYLKGRYGNEHPNYTIALQQQVAKLHFVPKQDPRIV